LPIFRWIAFAFAAIVVVLAMLAVAARFNDGPIAIFAGGPLVEGELVAADAPEPDWTLAGELDTIQLQLVTPPRSRTTWVVEYKGRLFVPCGYMNSTLGRLWKHWPVEAEADPRAIVRIGGKRYERELVRVTNDQLFAVLAVRVQRKYSVTATRATVEQGGWWFFELTRPGSRG